ncbi:MAG: MBL fold metallo-hydrolase [Paracoccaceae bacterium]|nr:MBL fold metallo-hydrolase [Paracoccaceae bacterium]
MPFKTHRISDRISLIQETGVAQFLRCNIWHVRGRDFDLVIDTGMGLSPLKDWICRETARPLKAVVTHCHFDHSGGLHEFDCRLGHLAEAQILADPRPKKVVYDGAWAKIEVVDPRQHPEFRRDSYRVKAAPLTGYLDEGDVIDLGDTAYQILHLPGHSPGSIGLWNTKGKTLFSGDALYDGDLLDNLYHSDKETYRQTLHRLSGLGVETFHAGHFPSFGPDRMRQLIDNYFQGGMTITDVAKWYEAEQARVGDIYGPQDWGGAKFE